MTQRLILVAFVCCLPLHRAKGASAIVGHRGASYDAPENTLAAFRLAYAQGADAAEGDFHLTRDGRIVCLHDKDLKRTAGVERRVADMTYEELAGLDVGAWKGAQWTGQRVATLAEVLATVPPGKRFFIEIKCGPEIVESLRQELAAVKMDASQLVVISFNEQVIAATRRAMPHIKAHWLTDYKQDRDTGKWSPSLDEVLGTLKAINASGLDTHANFNVIDGAFVKAIRDKGYELHAWTVNDPAAAERLVRLGFDSITTDRPGWLRAQLPSEDLRKHLQVYLKMDGDLRDASGHGRDAKWTGGGDEGAGATDGNTQGPAFATAVFGNGLNLESRQGSAAIQYRLPDAGSISLWYHARDWYDYQTVFDNAVDADQWEMWIYKSATMQFRNHRDSAKVQHAFHPRGDVNEWHHLAVTWDRSNAGGDAVRLYVNGQRVDAAGWKSRPWTAPGDTLHLGGGHEGNTKANGVFDDVAVFDTVLTDADVQRLMNLGVEAATQPPTSP